MNIGQRIKFTVFLPAVLMHEGLHYAFARKFGRDTVFKIPVSIDQAIRLAKIRDYDRIQASNQFGVETNFGNGTSLFGEILYFVAPILLLPIGVFIASGGGVINYLVAVQFLFGGLLSEKDLSGAWNAVKYIFSG